MGKRMICLFLSMVMCFGVLVTFSACGGGALDRETSADDFEWESKKGGVIITGYKGAAKTVAVPEVLDGKKVVEIDEEAFSGNIVIEALVLPKYVGSIDLGDELEGCDNLTYLEMRGSQANVEAQGYDCAPIKELSLPNTTSIRKGNVPNISTLTKVYAPKCTKIYRFKLSKSVKEITIKSQPVLANTKLYVKVGCEGSGHDLKYYLFDNRALNALSCDKQNYTPYDSAAYAEVSEWTEQNWGFDGEMTYDNLLIAENIHQYICTIFDRDEVTINGVTYQSTTRIEDEKNLNKRYID